MISELKKHLNGPDIKKYFFAKISQDYYEIQKKILELMEKSIIYSNQTISEMLK